RKEAPITRTLELAGVVRRVVPKSKDGIDPATRTFQALRIHVNDELGEVDRGLIGAEAVLAEGGRLVVVTFHSLEDRRVKKFMRDRSGSAPRPSRHAPIDTSTGPEPTFKVINRRAISATDEETRSNPRSRSAKLRAAERTAAPIWETQVRS
ncbi:MAG: 16S rRNA (cytosine(1402)-N(4))-methyltransferase, partial [Rhodospirillaceae bacterium]|nr:16S rRNA (cytosine(1402)-N(4))-methyltransferase [Rhodospirillaceae bacterium]